MLMVMDIRTIREYAFGGDVLVADIPSYLPQLVVDGELSYIEYGIDLSRPDLNYTAQQSTDLENWQPIELSSLHRLEGDYEVYRVSSDCRSRTSTPLLPCFS